MKKNIVLILCLSLIFTLAGCSSAEKSNSSAQSSKENQSLEDINTPEKAANDQNNVNEKKETNLNNKNSAQSTEASTDKQIAKDNNNTPQKITKVNSKDELYGGTYWDERRLGDNDLNLKNYCEVVISNVTNTSFDFTVYEVNKETENRQVIFLKNTAVFIGDGMHAAFYGKKYTLNFTFPSITELRISGFEPLEGKTYLNNKIPGHECS